MPIDLSKLENRRVTGKGITAQCPACGAAEGDRNGENHLIVFPDGRFACVAHPGDRQHRARIWDLVGSRTPPMPTIRPFTILRRPDKPLKGFFLAGGGTLGTHFFNP
jgi:hypothetical protein